MVTVVIPFAGAEGKTRLHTSASVRGSLAVAMLADVLVAARAVGRTRVVTPDTELVELSGIEVVADPGGGQGAAVAAALTGVCGAIVVVNADLPCVTPSDLLALADAMPAFVAGADGTTNALSLVSAESFAPLYGPGSAGRFRAHTGAIAVEIPNLADDVDTMEDLARLQLRAGPRTQACLAELEGSLV